MKNWWINIAKVIGIRFIGISTSDLVVVAVTTRFCMSHRPQPVLLVAVAILVPPHKPHQHQAREIALGMEQSVVEGTGRESGKQVLLPAVGPDVSTFIELRWLLNPYFCGSGFRGGGLPGFRMTYSITFVVHFCSRVVSSICKIAFESFDNPWPWHSRVLEWKMKPEGTAEDAEDKEKEKLKPGVPVKQLWYHSFYIFL